MNSIEITAPPTTVLLPKGDDSAPCLAAFEAATGITPPEFPGRKLDVVQDGITFYKVKGSDIPRLVNDDGLPDDTVGVTGSDSCESYIASGGTLSYQTVGSLMCKLMLLTTPDQQAFVEDTLATNDNYLAVATSYAPLLKRTGLKLLPVELSGSVEVAIKLHGVPAVADIVSSGETARANGLVEVANLLDIYPAIVTKSDSATTERALSLSDIDRIDTTLQRRTDQVDDPSITTYTLNLLRDSNKAGKKAGEEVMELAMALFGDKSAAECTGELADLIYAQLVAARSVDKPIALNAVLRILAARNKSATI